MVHLSISILILNCILLSKEIECSKKIKVMLSKRVRFEDNALQRLDSQIIEHFAKHLNFQTEYITTNRTLNEVFSEEDRFVEFSNSIQHLEIDVFIGSLDENLVTNKYLIASRPYYYDYFTWCVQSRQPIPIWKNFFYLCTDWKVYLYTTILAVMLTAIGYYTTQFEDRPITWSQIHLFVLGGAVGVGTAFNPQTHMVRCLFLLGLLPGIVFATTLNSIMMTASTSPILKPQFTSISEITNGGFKLVGDRYAFIQMLHQNEKYPKEIIRRFEVIETPYEHLQQLQWNDKLAVAISQEQTKNEDQISKLNIYCFNRPDIIYEYPLKILVSKEFKYLAELNKFIGMASETGLIVKWLKKCAFGPISDKPPLFVYTEINMESFMCFFFGMVSMQIFVCIVGVVEKYAYIKIQEPNVRSLWIYIDMALNPYRYFFISYYINRRRLMNIQE